MKIASMTITGKRGSAMIFRSGREIVINLDYEYGHNSRCRNSWTLPAGNDWRATRSNAARCLQAKLDGVTGTAGDVDEYARVVGQFAD